MFVSPRIALDYLVWIFWTSFLKFSKMFKLQTAESLTTTSRIANFKKIPKEKKNRMTTTLSTFPEINVSDIPVHIFLGDSPASFGRSSQRILKNSIIWRWHDAYNFLRNKELRSGNKYKWNIKDSQARKTKPVKKLDPWSAFISRGPMSSVTMN